MTRDLFIGLKSAEPALIPLFESGVCVDSLQLGLTPGLCIDMTFAAL